MKACGLLDTVRSGLKFDKLSIGTSAIIVYLSANGGAAKLYRITGTHNNDTDTKS